MIIETIRGIKTFVCCRFRKPEFLGSIEMPVNPGIHLLGESRTFTINKQSQDNLPCAWASKPDLSTILDEAAFPDYVNHFLPNCTSRLASR